MIQRALVAGLGSIGTRHLRLLREALPDADIRVLRRPGRGGDVPDADGCFNRLDEACAFAPELAIVSNPAPFHVATAAALAEAGAHLLVEKPVSHDEDGVADLLVLCAEKGRVLRIGYNLRFLESLQRFRDEVRSGVIGPVQAIRCEIGQYLPDWRPGSDYRETVSSQAQLGGGALLELSHELDMVRWVFGDVVWASAWMGRQSALDIDVEDCVMLQLGFAETGDVLPPPVAQVSMDFLRRDTTRICTAIGAEGTLRWDGVAGTVTRYDVNAGAWRGAEGMRPERDASYRAQIAAFLKAAGGAPDTIGATGEDGLAVMHLIEAARRSAGDDGRRARVNGSAA